MNPVKISIDPRLRMSYASYYIKGLIQFFGKKNVDFNLNVPDSLFNSHQDYNKGFVFLHNQYKVFVDFDDSSTVSTKHYEWCDLYAKINVYQEDLNRFEKLKPIGPSFGINILDLSSLMILLKVYLAPHRPVSMMHYIKDYVFLMVRRKRLSQYIGSCSEPDYVFSISTLWYDRLTAETTNRLRGNFLNICQRIFKTSEGGFFYINSEQVTKEFPEYPQYKIQYRDFLYNKRLSPNKYIEKTKKSCLVFNTPSVQGCLGWKLGEYFAMGKAIISSSINHIMPQNPEGAILFIKNEAEMEAAVIRLKNDQNLRGALEDNASVYFQAFLSPEAVIQSISKAIEVL